MVRCFTREGLFGPIKTEWKPGDTVEHSGVYRAGHGAKHDTQSTGQRGLEDQVICLEDQTFPRCNQGGDLVHFTLANHGEPIENNVHFKIVT